MFFDKNVLYDGKSIREVPLCVNTKAITRYAPGAGITYSRKIRGVSGKKGAVEWKTDKVFLCKPHLSSL